MKTVPCYAAPAARAPLEPMMIERRSVGPHDVLIQIEYVGICHSDIHTVRDEGKPRKYPVVPGHEIVGKVMEIGCDVITRKVGEFVGVGCMVNSCQSCEYCESDQEQFCDRGVGTYASMDIDGTLTQGGYATEIVVDEHFCLTIPDGTDHAAIAPLLCAGITTFSPLKQWGAAPGKKVAVVGMGGLGHVAVKIAAAMGAEVTVLSHSLAKQEDALRFGSKNYVSTADAAAMGDLANYFDLIINTVSVAMDHNQYLNLLKARGIEVLVGMPPAGDPIQPRSLLMKNRILTGSNMGGIAETQEMLEFCFEHGITAEVEVISASEINDAFERVVDSDVRYRFVIDASTFASSEEDRLPVIGS